MDSPLSPSSSSNLDQSLENLAREPNIWALIELQQKKQEPPPLADQNTPSHNNQLVPADPSSAASLDELTKRLAPKHMEELFRQLYRILQPALEPPSSAASRKNASTIIQGGRGCGKTLLVQQVLRAFDPQRFRLVYVHGILVPGSNVVTVVREMLRQLSIQANQGRTNEFVRLKTTSFTNQLQLLTEMIQIASIDGIPIVFVLDELEQFVKTTDHRQLLLYHLLDRVASNHSLCSLIGMTTDCSFLSRLEKRIKSRAEGTTQFLYLGSPKVYDKLIDILAVSLVEDQDNPYVAKICKCLKDSEELERYFRLGYNIRWFRRVLYQAVALYLHDIIANNSESPSFVEEYLQEAMKALLVRRSDLADLRGAQVALVFAARRVLFRESVNNQANAIALLTFTRMESELKSFQGASTFSHGDVWNAFLDLLEMGIFRPASDHTGNAPLMYEWDGDDPMDVDETTTQETILHLTLDIHREIKPAIDDNVFQCSTALREWGRKTI